MTPAPGAPARPLLPPPPAPEWGPVESPCDATVGALAEALSLPRTLCRLLAARGVGEIEAAKRYLRPLLDHLHPAGSLEDADRAVGRLLRALREGETVLVHGDYDVDGIAGAALMTRWLRHLGGRAVPFVPHRLRDGYDLGAAGIRAARDAGATLLLTVDCGILAHDAVRDAAAAGLDVVVTDHHAPGAALPAAAAVVNPSRPDCGYPHKGLCGTGVAFKLCQLLAAETGTDPAELWPHLDLVALATVADLVPLEDENRTLVRYGLRALAASEKVGVRALLEVTGLSGRALDAGHVGFVLGPRLNAAGRVGEAAAGLRLLLTEDEEEAGRLAREMDEENRRRRSEDRRILGEAEAMLAETYDPERDFGVVLASEGWHPGVIGIVASRVVERIHRPVILVALDGERGRGSARSIPGFHLLEAVTACAEHLERFGGHRQAAGMDVRADAVEGLREAFRDEAERRLRGTPLRPTIRPDLEVRLPELTPELHRLIQYFGPFGIGNARPVLLAREVGLSQPPRAVGRGHLKVRMVQDGVVLDGIGFRLAERVSPDSLAGARALDVAFQLQEDEYRGRRRLQARILDVRPSGPAGAGASP